MRSIAEKKALRRLLITVVALIVLLAVGTVGYSLIEGWAVDKSFYMAVITFSTVGFGEVEPLSEGGRLFTVALIFGGGGVAAYALSSVTEFVFSGELKALLEQRRRKRMLDHLSDHTIVCGYGRVGRHVAGELTAQGMPFIVIDVDAEKVAQVREEGHLALEGNAATEDDLFAAGIERARSMLVTSSSDAENVFVCLTARSMNPDLNIVARGNYDESENKLLRAGASRVILPYRITGRRMASVLARPGVADFLDEVMHANNLELLVDQVALGTGSSLEGKTLGEAHLRSRLGITVLACRLPGERINTSPGADTILRAGSLLIVLGTREQLQGLTALAHDA